MYIYSKMFIVVAAVIIHAVMCVVSLALLAVPGGIILVALAWLAIAILFVFNVAKVVLR